MKNLSEIKNTFKTTTGETITVIARMSDRWLLADEKGNMEAVSAEFMQRQLNIGTIITD